MERIGHERWDIVREIFRNLITSQGTRVARTTDELLSVFEDRSAARAVLDQLVDARLLTSFELASDGTYFRIARTSSSLSQLTAALERLDRTAFGAEEFEDYEPFSAAGAAQNRRTVRDSRDL